MTPELAESTLADVFRSATRIVRLPDIETAICDVFGIDARSLQSHRKSKTLAQPRMLAMWLARKFTRAAFSEIGEYFGRRSHSTVISAQKKVDHWLADGGKVQLGPADCDVREVLPSGSPAAGRLTFAAKTSLVGRIANPSHFVQRRGG